MQVKAKKLGRPLNSEVDVRTQLINHARQLFLCMPYEKVSIRLITRKVGVSSALIRYYFGDKEKLFELVISDIAKSIYNQVRSFSDCNSYEGFVQVATQLFQSIKNIPQLPSFLERIMGLPVSDPKRKIVESTFIEQSISLYDELFDKLLKAGVIRQGLDLKLCRLSWVKLTFDPFIMTRQRYGLQGIEIEEQFLDKVFEHNIQLMTLGLVNTH